MTVGEREREKKLVNFAWARQEERHEQTRRQTHTD
jgi:hypothetical protein